MEYKEYFIYDSTKALTAGTGTTWDEIITRIDTDANFEINKTTFVATNDRIRLRIKDSAKGIYLSKGQPDIKSIAGRNTLAMGLSNAFLPFIWPEAYIVAAGSSLSVEAADYSNAANTLRFALHGSKIRNGVAPWKAKEWRARKAFSYSFTSGPITVAANATSSQNIEIDIDAHFLVMAITGIRTGDALVTLGEDARGKAWMNTSIHIDNVLGNGAFPNKLPSPRFIPRGSVVYANIQDISGLSNVIDVNLIGYKLYE